MGIFTKEESIEIRPGRRIFYRITGSQTPTYQILFLHGTCASSQQYNGVVQELVSRNNNNSDHHVVCHSFDAISCGASPMVRDWDAYRTDESVLDVQNIMKTQLDSTIPTLLVAHSYAPTILIRYIHRHGIPPNVKGCIFLSSAIHGEANPVPNGGHPIFKLPIFILNCLQPSMSKSFLEMAYHPTTSPTIIAQALQSNNGNNMYMAKAYHTHHEWATREECSTLVAQNLPILVVHGKDDKILPKQAGEQLADAVKATKFVTIDNTSHQVMEENPNAIAELIVKFINEIK